MTEGQTLSNGPSIQMKDDIPEIFERNHSSSRVTDFACVFASCDILTPASHLTLTAVATSMQQRILREGCEELQQSGSQFPQLNRRKPSIEYGNTAGLGILTRVLGKTRISVFYLSFRRRMRPQELANNHESSLTPACCLTTDLSSVAGLASNQSANDEEGERLLCTEGGDKIHTFTGHPNCHVFECHVLHLCGLRRTAPLGQPMKPFIANVAWLKAVRVARTGVYCQKFTTQLDRGHLGKAEYFVQSRETRLEIGTKRVLVLMPHRHDERAHMHTFLYNIQTLTPHPPKHFFSHIPRRHTRAPHMYLESLMCHADAQDIFESPAPNAPVAQSPTARYIIIVSVMLLLCCTIALDGARPIFSHQLSCDTMHGIPTPSSRIYLNERQPIVPWSCVPNLVSGVKSPMPTYTPRRKTSPHTPPPPSLSLLDPTFSHVGQVELFQVPKHQKTATTLLLEKGVVACGTLDAQIRATSQPGFGSHETFSHPTPTTPSDAVGVAPSSGTLALPLVLHLIPHRGRLVCNTVSCIVCVQPKFDPFAHGQTQGPDSVTEPKIARHHHLAILIPLSLASFPTGPIVHKLEDGGPLQCSFTGQSSSRSLTHTHPRSSLWSLPHVTALSTSSTNPVTPSPLFPVKPCRVSPCNEW
ncbi:uncharacterized protein CLUP02_16048 [Colletotrichum lupini]|uniref:Uncharacterized protein n=1 Tax=Colletotrichum lupini TaxID=145971 RepID=A0A9Q8WNU8_9PEZI|nr:uncharacterized protein CLUP02_16048 [Colletotrichum lupini]UQC90518.1 hypothetical protein CLUP02_16048 [Colletotrichum lupini]